MSRRYNFRPLARRIKRFEDQRAAGIESISRKPGSKSKSGGTATTRIQNETKSEDTQKEKGSSGMEAPKPLKQEPAAKGKQRTRAKERKENTDVTINGSVSPEYSRFAEKEGPTIVNARFQNEEYFNNTSIQRNIDTNTTNRLGISKRGTEIESREELESTKISKNLRKKEDSKKGSRIVPEDKLRWSMPAIDERSRVELYAQSLSEYKSSLTWQRYLQAHKVIRYKHESKEIVKAVQEECVRNLYIKGDPKITLLSRTFKTEDPLDEERPDGINAMVIHQNRIFQQRPTLLKYVTRLYLKNVWHLNSVMVNIIIKNMRRNQLCSLSIHDINDKAEKIGAQLVDYFSIGLQELYTSMKTKEMRSAIDNCRELHVLSFLEFDKNALKWLFDKSFPTGKIVYLRFKVPLSLSQIDLLVRYAPKYRDRILLDISVEEQASKLFNAFGQSIQAYNTIDDSLVGSAIRKAVDLAEVDMIISYDRFLSLVEEIYFPGMDFECLQVLRFHLMSENLRYPSALIDGINLIAEHALSTWQLRIFELTCSVPHQIADELADEFTGLWSFTPSLQEVRLNLTMEDKCKRWGAIVSDIAFDLATTYGINDVFINQNKEVTPRLQRDVRQKLKERWEQWEGHKVPNFVIDRKHISTPLSYWMQ